MLMHILKIVSIMKVSIFVGVVIVVVIVVIVIVATVVIIIIYTHLDDDKLQLEYAVHQSSSSIPAIENTSFFL